MDNFIKFTDYFMEKVASKSPQAILESVSDKLNNPKVKADTPTKVATPSIAKKSSLTEKLDSILEKK